MNWSILVAPIKLGEWREADADVRPHLIGLSLACVLIFFLPGGR
jgi:hypothetical protein